MKAILDTEILDDMARKLQSKTGTNKKIKASEMPDVLDEIKNFIILSHNPRTSANIPIAITVSLEEV